MKNIEAITDPEILNRSFNDLNQYKLSLEKLVKYLKKSEKFPIEKIQLLQEKKLKTLLNFSYKYSNYYQHLFDKKQIDLNNPNIFEEFRQIPLLERQDIQNKQKDIETKFLYQSHLPTAYTQTSGSSGQPVRILRNGVTERFWQAYTMREHEWYKRDFTKKLFAFRANLPKEFIELPNWGIPAAILQPNTANSYAMKINQDITEQLEYLQKTNPSYIISYPSNLSALLDLIDKEKAKLPNLEEIKTIGETLTDNIRLKAKEILNINITDIYSSQEVGSIAIQCPDSIETKYHIMAETMLVEILDENNQEVKEGEFGKIVVTDLINFSMPLVRYNIGDFAIKGKQCNCKRNLPTIEKILGRKRNMAFHNGKRFWPLFGFSKFREISSIKQYQIIQTSNENLIFKYVDKQSLNKFQQQQLRKIISNAIGFDAIVEFEHHTTSLSQNSSSKFEEFICKI